VLVDGNAAMSAKGSGMSRINAWLEARRATAAGDERGAAMVSVILFMILLTGMSAVLLSVVLGQISFSYASQKTTKTVYAAQAGLQAGLGIVRTAAAAPDSVGKVWGSLSKLPCSFTGNLDGSTNATSYSVTMYYFTADPTGQSDTWINANKLACSTTGGLTVQPAFALVRSEGQATAIPGQAASVGNRYLSATYKFRINNVNIAGGRIFDLGKSWCLDAETATAGSKVKYVPTASCTNDADELWIYDTTYQIKLASSTVTGSTPLCITGPATSGGATQSVKLQNCMGATDPARWNQLWSWVGGERWMGQNQAIATGNSSYCLSSNVSDGSSLTGKDLMVSTTCYGNFGPEAAVGAGAASYGTHQIVNYKQFGRCADVTNQSITYAFMIVYPCKQDPTGTGVNLLWNHKWYYTEPITGQTSLGNQQIYVNLNDVATQKYCLQTPATGSGSFYPVFVTCTTAATQKWTRYYNTGTYATSYVFTDTYGRCLTADTNDVYASSWAKMTVTTCNGSEVQKWNAPPIFTDASFGSYKEYSQ
jgi:hypothetical protein